MLFRSGPSSQGTVFRLSPPSAGKTAWTETVLHAFTGKADGGYPQNDLISDSAGNLYGEAGVVFKLTRPVAGKTNWTETVLHSFTGKADGDAPQTGLVFDAAGNLYGTTSGGGASKHGTVFKLTRPTSGNGAWTATILHSFSLNAQGGEPLAGLIFDEFGNLYGTTVEGGAFGQGTVFKLAP